MGEAIETTQKLYPGLLERNANLLFMLKCRQFIEMVNGTDSEVRGSAMRSPRSRHGSGSNRSSPSMSPVHSHTIHPRSSTTSATGTYSGSSSPNRIIPTKSHSSHSNQDSSAAAGSDMQLHTISESEMNAANAAVNGEGGQTSGVVIVTDNDVDMQDSDMSSNSDERTVSNGSSSATNGTCVTNGVGSEDLECDMGKYATLPTYNQGGPLAQVLLDIL